MLDEIGVDVASQVALLFCLYDICPCRFFRLESDDDNSFLSLNYLLQLSSAPKGRIAVNNKKVDTASRYESFSSF